MSHQMREKQIGKMIQKKKLQEKKESKELVKVCRPSHPFLLPSTSQPARLRPTKLRTLANSFQ